MMENNTENNTDSNTDNNEIKEEPKKADVPNNPDVVGIRFRACGKVYTFDANKLDLKPGARVIVDSEMGLSIGSVVTLRLTGRKTKETFKKVVRIVSERDLETIEKNRAIQDEAKAFCVKKSKELKLDMKVVTTETTLDKKRLIFYFTADGRIDFRELVRDLAAKFKTRIEMRQIGVRDEVKMLGGVGGCGRQTCCSQFLTSFAPITIRMAKQQDLSINQSKLSGICGRLMCCLGYEYKNAPDKKQRTENTAVITKAEENSDELVAADSESVDTQKAAGTREPGVIADKQEKVDGPRQQERKEDTREKTTEKKRPPRGSRRRRRRRGGAKVSADASVKPQQQDSRKPDTARPDTAKPDTAKLDTAKLDTAKLDTAKPDTAKPTETKGKGRPFNKRKRFWKKKKKEQ